MAVYKLSNANVYLNGQSLVGKVDEITVPNLKPVMVSKKPLGLQSEVEMPSGYEKLEVTVKWSALYLDVLAQIANVGLAHTFQIYANQYRQESFGEIKTGENLKIVLGGIMKEFPLGGAFKQNEAVDIQTVTSVRSLLMAVGAVPLVEIDVLNNIYNVGGKGLVDLFGF